MICEYCNTTLQTLSSLKLHQKTAKYCLSKQNNTSTEEHSCDSCDKKFNRKSSLDNHLKICKENSFEKDLRREFENREKELVAFFEKDRIIQEKDRIIQEQKLIIEEQKLIIEEQKLIIKESDSDYKNKLERQIKDLQHMMKSMVEKAIDKPSTSTINQNTTNNLINNLLPITTEHLDEQVRYLTIDHVKHGAVGYAKYALEYPLKDRLVCTDTSRKKGKYKDSDGNVVSDPEMATITKKLFLAIKERNSVLVSEYANDLKAKLDSFNSSDNNEMTTEESAEMCGMTDELIDLITSIFSQKRQSNEMADGLKPDLFHQFVKELATGSYRSK
jgi:hypothetical protein